MAERQDELVHELARMPGVAEALVVEHARQLDGRCGVCRECCRTARAVHPCRPYTLAVLALTQR